MQVLRLRLMMASIFIGVSVLPGAVAAASCAR
jgi:hypothetical protein